MTIDEAVQELRALADTLSGEQEACLRRIASRLAAAYGTKPGFNPHLRLRRGETWNGTIRAPSRP